MKKVLFLIVAMVTLTTSSLMAGIPISKDYKVTIHDELWMDMAVTVAKDGVKEGGIPCGTVIVLNGALKCVGEPTNKATSVETAIAMSRMASLENAVIYTINEPTIEAYNMICRFGADAVYFVNSKEKVIAAGVQPAEAYDESNLDASLTQVPMKQIEYEDAAALLK